MSFFGFIALLLFSFNLLGSDCRLKTATQPMPGAVADTAVAAEGVLSTDPRHPNFEGRERRATTQPTVAATHNTSNPKSPFRLQAVTSFFGQDLPEELIKTIDDYTQIVDYKTTILDYKPEKPKLRAQGGIQLDDQRILIFGTGSPIIRALNAPKSEPIKIKHKGAKAFRLLGGKFATADDRKVKIWNPINLSKPEATINVGEGIDQITQLQNTDIAAACANRIRIFDLNGNLKREIPFKSKDVTHRITQLQDGRLAVLEYASNIMRIWNLDGNLEAEFELNTRGHIACDFTQLPDGKLASFNHEKEIKRWNLQDLSKSETLCHDTEFIYDIFVLPDGRLMTFGSHNCDSRNIKIWDLETSSTKPQVQFVDPYPSHCPKLSQSGTIVATDLQKGVCVFTPQNRQLKKALQLEEAKFKEEKEKEEARLIMEDALRRIEAIAKLAEAQKKAIEDCKEAGAELSELVKKRELEEKRKKLKRNIMFCGAAVGTLYCTINCYKFLTRK